MYTQYVINAFEDGPFTGNPAAVVPLESWPDDSILQAIATQNNLSETAYFVDGGDRVKLRWFTPSAEIELCGHATLATAHAIFAELGDGREQLVFDTMSGELAVARDGDRYRMDFPEVRPADVATDAVKLGAHAAAGVESGEVLLAGDRVFLVLESAEHVRRLRPDLAAVEQLPRGDLLVSSPGADGFDIFTRMFAPGVGIPEDPATGSAHCAFAPYWCERLGRREISSFQASARGGYFACRWRPDDGRVDLTGACSTFLRGSISV